MATIEREITMFFSSDTNAGAQQKSTDGSTFRVILDSPIKISGDILQCKMAVLSSTYWYTSPNISATYGNNIFDFNTTDVGNAGNHTITITAGLYSLDSLNSYLGIKFQQLGLPSNLFTITGLDSTQQTNITFLRNGDTIKWTTANNIGNILGFGSSPNVTSTSIDFNSISPDIAVFNRIDNLFITTDMITQGIPINNITNGIIQRIPILVSPGSQQTYEPQHLQWIDVTNDLLNRVISNISFRLVDQDLRLVDTNGENYSFALVIKILSQV